MEILDYIKEGFIYLVPFLYVLGFLIKKSNIDDIKIPFILLFISIIFSIGIGFKDIYIAPTFADKVVIIFNTVIQGVLVAGTTVLGNQLWKQNQKRIQSKRNSINNKSKPN